MYKLIKTEYPYYQYKKATKKSKGALFFIHGYAVNSNYHNFFSDLLDDYDYYAVEHAGHGITPLNSKKQLRPFSYALEIVELIKKLDLKNIILMGHSMGGGISVMVAQMIPERVRKLVIVTPMNSKGTTSIRGVFNFLFRFNPKTRKQLPKFYRILLHDYDKTMKKVSNEELDELIQFHVTYKKNMNKLKHRMASLSNMNKLKKYEKNIKVPAILLVGKSDGCINPKSTAKNFKKKNKNIKVYEFQKSGHVPFLEETKTYYKVIRDFIDE